MSGQRDTAPIWLWPAAIAFALAGAGGAWLYQTRNLALERQAAAIAANKDAAVQDKAQGDARRDDAAKAGNGTADQSRAIALPQFGLLRIEKDGSALVAGAAPPGADIELLANGKVIGRSKAEEGGDFVIVPDAPLKRGGHELSLRAILPDGRISQGEETGVVDLPPDGGEVVALIAKAGEASRIVQKPEPEIESGPLPEPPARVKDEQAAALQSPGKDAEARVEVAPQSKDAGEAARQVMVEAVDVEDGRIFVAGSGEPGRSVNIYLDDRLLGSAVIGREGGFLLEVDGDMEQGEHRIRADLLGRDEKSVERRAEVPLIHEVAKADKAAEAPKAAEEAAKSAEAPGAAASGEIGMTARIAAAPQAANESGGKSADESGKAAMQSGSEANAVLAPDAAAIAAAPPQIEPLRTGASVIIRRGDNLWRVSRRMLGRGIAYTVIYEANRAQIRDPDLIYPGQVFDVPGGTGPAAGKG